MNEQTQKTPVHLCFSFMDIIDNSEITKLFRSAFFDAIKRYDRESLSYFFQSEKSNEVMKDRNEQGESALHIAVKAGHSSKYKFIVFINRFS